MSMSAQSFGLRQVAKRAVASFIFVYLCNPIDPLVLKIQSQIIAIPILALVAQWGAIIALHAYLVNRARYALKAKGAAYFISLFTMFYVSVSSWSLDMESITTNFVVYIYILLSSIYSYGLSFGPLDARASGLVHTAEITR